MELDITDDKVKLTQTAANDRLIQVNLPTPTQCLSPMPADLVLLTQDDTETKPDITKFQSLCGSLNHISPARLSRTYPSV